MAILLIDIGFFALMSGTVLVARGSTAARARGGAMSVAQTRVDSLAIGACRETAARSGAAAITLAGPARESWSLTPVPVGSVSIRDSIAFTAWGRATAAVVSTTVWC